MGTQRDGEWRDGGTEEMPKAELAAWLRARVAGRAPAAIVRFGDVEARLLSHDPSQGEPGDAILRGLERRSGLRLSQQDAAEIAALVNWAFDEADVLGIVPEGRRERHRSLMREVEALYAERVAAGRRPAALAHNLLGHDLLDELPDLLTGRRASVISCRDLRPILEGGWGVEDVGVYQVPSEHMTRDVDGPYEAAMHDVPIWPDIHARVCSELTVRERGEVFLVGAGPFGKDFCIRIRDQGGIALDMGSALDQLADKLTRGPKRRAFDLYAQGLTAREVAARLEGFFGVEIGEETIQEGIEEAAREEVADWRARPLRPVYATVCLDTLQVDIGEDGESRRRACQIGLGIGPDGHRERLGIWWESGPTGWRGVLEDLCRRGVRELSIICPGSVQPALLEAAKGIFPRAEVRADSAPVGSAAAIRAAIERHGSFPDEQAVTVLVHFALNRAESR